MIATKLPEGVTQSRISQFQRHRQLYRIDSGFWVLVTTTDVLSTETLWCQVDLIIEITLERHGRLVRLMTLDPLRPDDPSVLSMGARTDTRLSLTAGQAKKCGLVLPAPAEGKWPVKIR